ncbi:MAG: serine hydrolase domain-containing protein [Myxococcota bacterium]
MPLTRRSVLKFAGATMASAACARVQLSDTASTTQQRQGSWVPGREQIDTIQIGMQTHRVPAVGIAIIENGKLAWNRTFGLTNVATGQRATNATLFQAASLTKPLFAYAVMHMVERQRIDLDSRLADYYRPPNGYVDTDWMRSITVRHVLSHSTGLPNWREEPGAMLEPAFAPGSGYSYSGEAFHWLQQVIETITGQGLHTFIANCVLGPARLTDMALLWLPERDEREVHGHIVDESGQPELAALQFAREHGYRLQEVSERWGRSMKTWTTHDLDAAHALIKPHTFQRLAARTLEHWNMPAVSVIDSASSLRTTPQDYARFMCAMMRSSSQAHWQISDRSRQLMLTPTIERGDDLQALPAGLGWSLERRSDGIAFMHWGKNGDSHISVCLGEPHSGRGLVVMTNGSRGGPLIEDLVLALTGVEFASIV